MNSRDGYVLSRDHRGAARLNYQHLLWKETLNFNMHPSIPIDPTSPYRIADVACGTGLWVSEVARALPYAQVDGFDISLAHSPPAEWLPRNSQIVKWDMFTEPAAEWLGAYDVVHVRLIQLVVEAGDPRPTIRQMARLLKPGGYFQWDELETGASYMLRTAACEAAGPDLPTLDGIARMLVNLCPWIGRLRAEVEAEPDLFEEARLFRYRDPVHIARAFFDMHLEKDEEMAETSFKDDEQGENILRNIGLMLDESKHGAVLCTPKVVLVCRRTE